MAERWRELSHEEFGEEIRLEFIETFEFDHDEQGNDEITLVRDDSVALRITADGGVLRFMRSDIAAEFEEENRARKRGGA